VKKHITVLFLKNHEANEQKCSANTDMLIKILLYKPQIGKRYDLGIGYENFYNL